MTTEEILRNNLTSDQYDAVVDDSKNILCLACAGSGKLDCFTPQLHVQKECFIFREVHIIPT